MAEFFTINRYALTLRPSAAMTEWLNGLYPDDQTPYQPKPNHEDTDIYLLPEFEDIEEALEWLEENYLDFFEAALENWCADESEWPEQMDWELFQEFFDFSLQSEVVDTVSRLQDEAFAEDFEDDEDFDLEGGPDADDEDWEG